MHIACAAGDVLDYSIDWTNVLIDDTDSLVASVWTMPDGLMAGAAGVDGAFSTQWIEASAVGIFTVRCRISTSYGRQQSRSFVLHVVEAMS